MKVCLISDYIGIQDEGTRKFANYLDRGLSSCHKVLHLPVNNVFSLDFWRKIYKFNPDIIHHTPGPTLKSFVFSKLLKLHCPKARVIMSVMHPAINPSLEWLVPLLRPHLLLVQSQDVAMRLARLGCTTYFVPSGVNIERFRPLPEKMKEELKRKYGLENNFVILHVGSITTRRNVTLLKSLQDELDIQAVVLGSLSVPAESDVLHTLSEARVKIIMKYLENIEEIYALADCYIFPVFDRRASIDIPLTVLEAMACNLPVITTRFGGLPYIFKEGDGLMYVDKPKDFVRRLYEVRIGNVNVDTRGKVLPYRWSNVVTRVEKAYYQVIER